MQQDTNVHNADPLGRVYRPQARREHRPSLLQGAARATVDAATSLSRTDSFRPWQAFLLIVFHMVLAIGMYRSPLIATLHAMTAIGWYAHTALTTKRIDYLAIAMAYVAGSEVLWRSTYGYVPVEAARYAISLFSIVAMMRYKDWRLPWPPLIYLIFLLPSILLTITVPTLEMGRDKTILKLVVFNTIGPVSLTIAVCFFTRVRLNALQLMRVCFGFVMPIMGLAAIMVVALRAGKVSFGRTSVSVIRDEFGPNQLSAALGLGALFLFFMLILDEEATLRRRLVMIGGMIVLLGATAMTFSRGGMYNFAGALAVAIFFLLRDTASRLRVGAIVLVGFLAGNYVVLPALNQYSNGFLVKRFSSTDLTGRDKIAWADLEIWRANPIYGVGPGRAIDTRVWLYRRNQAHTEFTRMLGEHGIGGFISLVALLYMAATSLVRKRGPRNQAIAAAMIVWSFLYMTNAAMRLVAPSFVFGLACAFLDCEFGSDVGRERVRRVSRRRLVARNRPVLASPRRSLGV